MKRRQIQAILLSAVITFSSIIPVSGISAFAAEGNTGAEAAAAAAETAGDEGSDTDTTMDPEAAGAEQTEADGAEDANTDKAESDEGAGEADALQAENGSTDNAGTENNDPSFDEDGKEDSDSAEGGESAGEAENADSDSTNADGADSEDADAAVSDNNAVGDAIGGDGSSENTEADAADDEGSANPEDNTVTDEEGMDAADAVSPAQTGGAEADTADPSAGETADAADPAAGETTDAPKDHSPLTGTISGPEYVRDKDDGVTPDELFEAYVCQSFGLEEEIPENVKGKRESTVNALNSTEKKIFNVINSKLPGIAAGEIDSSSFVMKPEFWQSAPWTAGDLGVSTLFDFDDGQRVISRELREKMDEMFTFDVVMINNALTADNPALMYWYDKTQGVHIEYPSYSVKYYEKEDEWKVILTSNTALEYSISRDYALNPQQDEYKLDTSKARNVQKAVANANAIVDKYKDNSLYSDVTKLNSYSHEITDLSTYNDAAAAPGYPYGDPSQLVWVFDGDPDTKVICEGYAKAFQYLCDRTKFASDKIDCITVYGLMNDESGRHAWNVVKMDDGENYLVDVTNSGEEMIGRNDKLFLVGAPGNIRDYYRIQIDENHSILYKYNDVALRLYRENELKLAEHNYHYQSINGAVVELDQNAFDYDGNAKEPKVVSVTLNGTRLGESDYVVARYAQNINAGTGKVIITGTGAYGGVAEGKFTINKVAYPISLEANEITIMPYDTYYYWNKKRESTKAGEYYFAVLGLQGALDIDFDSTTFVQPTRDSEGFQNGFRGVAPGSATLTFKAKETDNYLSAVLKLKVNVGQYDLSSAKCKVTVDGKDLVYNGKEKKPAVTVTYDGVKLTQGTDYTVKYSNNVNAGKGQVVVTGSGKTAVKSKEQTFVITKAAQSFSVKEGTAAVNIQKPVAVAAGQSKVYTIAGQAGKITGAKCSAKNVTATVSGSKVTVKGVTPGAVKVTVTAAETANYKAGSRVITFHVLPGRTTRLIAANQPKGIKLTWNKVPGATGYLVYRDNKLIKTINSGATVNFTDTGTVTNGKKYLYKIAAKSSLGTSPLHEPQSTYFVSQLGFKKLTSAAAGKMTLNWSKNAKASGYQIQYSLKKDYSGAKNANISNIMTVSKTITGLKRGKVYYVKVRAYKNVGKFRFYSAWSASKKVKVK